MTPFDKAQELKDNFPDLTIEVVGRWIWVSGATKPHKEALRLAGLFWSSGKTKWYWNGQASKRRGHRWSYQQIIGKYGASRIETPEPVTA